MTSINWRAIIIAAAICFGVGCFLGIAWGSMAFAIAATSGPSTEGMVDYLALPVVALIVGFIPSIVGAAYLGMQLESRWLMHGAAYAFLNSLVAAIFILMPSEEGISLGDVWYSLLLFPVSVATVYYAARFHGPMSFQR